MEESQYRPFRQLSAGAIYAEELVLLHLQSSATPFATYYFTVVNYSGYNDDQRLLSFLPSRYNTSYIGGMDLVRMTAVFVCELASCS